LDLISFEYDLNRFPKRGLSEISEVSELSISTQKPCELARGFPPVPPYFIDLASVVDSSTA
jgi:hypothetical protein